MCHPHPSYGGNRFDHVVGALFEALPTVGIATLRFDFRSQFGDGIAEVDDAAAAVELLSNEVPGAPVIAAGYSFGAMVALALDPEVSPVSAKVLVAPPLAAMEIPAAPEMPTLVLTPEHDQFTPPSTAEPIVTAWPRSTFVTIPMADHFLHGRTSAIVDLSLPWIESLLA